MNKVGLRHEQSICPWQTGYLYNKQNSDVRTEGGGDMSNQIDPHFLASNITAVTEKVR